MLLSQNQLNCVAVTESWLNNDIDDDLVSISGYNIFRKDRCGRRRGGGICVYVSQGIHVLRRIDLESDNFECLWLWLRPTRLPRPLSGIAVCIVYHPPGLPVEDHLQFNEYLVSTIDTLRNQYPNSGLVLLGDFNDFDTANILSSHSLKQVVKAPTRGTAILDLIITNQSNFYETPKILAPLGSSDHNIVTWSPRPANANCLSRTKPAKRRIRLYPRSGVDAFGRWIATRDWFSEQETNTTVDELTSSFTSNLTDAIDRIFPLKTVKWHQTDKPWITPGIKKLIKDRQKAFHNHDAPRWQSLRYKVQEEITKRKKSFYKNKVQHLKSSDCRKWWKIINKMSGKSETTNPFTLERNGETLNNSDMSNALNKFYISVNTDIPPLDMNLLPSFLPSNESIPTIECYEVCKKLRAVQPFKAPGPDNVPCRILKEFAYILAEPITTLFNASLSAGIVPSIWKESNIIPIPKAKQPTSEGDTRPISLTSCLSKVLEDFVVTWLIEDVKEKIDPSQFGCLKGTSTSFCLLDMLHAWLSHLDGRGTHLRICFLDFSKAFDRIGYNLLIEKLINLGVRRSLIPWIINFLSDRRQRVKFGEATSDWLPVNAGVPQGTKLGPILFLIMVNNLRIISPVTRMRKYVDDVSTSENLSRNSVSTSQSTLDSVQLWASDNWMKLNVKKCKELRVSFLGETPQLQPLTIDGHPVETVHSHKVLGLTVQNNLKWDEHILETVSKASKRLHILRVLRRSGVPPADLLPVYFALIRSILEYCCVVWHNSIPCHLSDKLEKIQKRAMRIMYPKQSYKEALLLAECPRLKDRRDELCSKTLMQISRGGPLAEHVTQTRAQEHEHNIRTSNNLSTYKCRTDRFKNSFFPKTISIANVKAVTSKS